MGEPRVYYQDSVSTVVHGDCREWLPQMEPASVDSCVTDPPYHLVETTKRFANHAAERVLTGAPGVYVRHAKGFMGQTWDGGDVAFRVDTWRAALRVLRPGGHLVAFGGTRTYHRMACAVEDAGFEIRDCLMWLYGSGFPKSHDVGKGIDKMAGVEREVVGTRQVHAGVAFSSVGATELPVTLPATPEAQAWQGWGTALKPAVEPIILARKPLEKGTVAANVLAYGTGAINVDGCRIGHRGGTAAVPDARPNLKNQVYGHGMGGVASEPLDAGRWPANVLLDEEAAILLDAHSGEWESRPFVSSTTAHRNIYGNGKGSDYTGRGYTDSGGASRFFYTAKASSSERQGTTHPTVKPVSLMRWLVRLVTPPGGLVLDPFAGSGTTRLAALAEGFRCVLIEKEAAYLEQLCGRHAQVGLPLEVA